MVVDQFELDTFAKLQWAQAQYWDASDSLRTARRKGVPRVVAMGEHNIKEALDKLWHAQQDMLVHLARSHVAAGYTQRIEVQGVAILSRKALSEKIADAVRFHDWNTWSQSRKVGRTPKRFLYRAA